MRGPEIADDHPPDTDRIFTIPNIISLLRLAGIPVFVWLLATDHRLAAAVALAVIAGTDWVDGGLARRWHQVTTLGKVLDPTIDRLLLVTAFVGVLLDGSMPVWLGIVLLSREVLVGLGGLLLGMLGHRRINVTWHGKVYAFGIMCVIPLFLVANTDVFWAEAAEVAAWVIVVPSAVLSWVTAVQYARTALSKSEK